MGLSIESIQILLFAAVIAALISRMLRIPYSVGLVLLGALLATHPFISHFQVSKELIYNVLLPPLIFEAALFLPRQDLRRDFSVIITLSTVGVLLAAAATTYGIHLFLGWPWMSAAIFGALIAATDPVSVIAIFKELGVPKRLKLLIEAESLFNDGTAAIVFTTLIGIATTHHFSPVAIVADVVKVIIGSLCCGFFVARILLYLSSKARDHLLELTLTSVIAYSSFLLAEHFHLSGILSVLVSGLVVAHHLSHKQVTEKGRLIIQSFWEYLAFLSNTFVFLIIGISVAQQSFHEWYYAAPVAIIAVLVGRVVAIYPLAFLFSRSEVKVSRAYQLVLFWGGLRGALALALALGLPAELAYREQIVTLTFIVVGFSILVQGITITPLLRYLGIEKSAPMEN
jgi:CPA1 family monovalent cation:H+ antiporter